MLRGDEAQLFRDHETALRAAVRHFAAGSEAIVDDACAHAWLALCRLQPERTNVFAWLRMVAVYRAWHLAGHERRLVALDGLPEAAQPAADTLEASVDAHEALALMSQLPSRQQRLLALRIAGYSRAEISRLTGDTIRTVDRQLHRSHQRLRHLHPVA
jgi:RNA polymerase sigma factor (sigma-70 family)